jgi:hypothetical protein
MHFMSMVTLNTSINRLSVWLINLISYTMMQFNIYPVLSIDKLFDEQKNRIKNSIYLYPHIYIKRRLNAILIS